MVILPDMRIALQQFLFNNFLQILVLFRKGKINDHIYEV